MFHLTPRLRPQSLTTIPHQSGARIQYSLKPTTSPLPVGMVQHAVRSKAQLIAENALLRHQLIILHRQVKRPELSNRDRLRPLLLARATPFWRQALLIV